MLLGTGLNGYGGVNVSGFQNEPLDEGEQKHKREPSGSKEFHEITKRDAPARLRSELDKLIEEHPEQLREECRKELNGFAELFGRYLTESSTEIKWDAIQKLPPNSIIQHADLSSPSLENVKEMLKKLVMIKLNGGLGTSMGCHGPKSSITVRNDLTFLDLTVQQIQHLNKTYDTNVPLVLMNSFNTSEETAKIIQRYEGLQLQIYTFSQSAYPRIYKDTLLPVPKNCVVDKNSEGWYPPGHGDFYKSFKNSGLLDKFIKEGRTYCFISNIDNLGATVDLNILNHIFSSKEEPEFVIELTDKTKADVKGGTLIQYQDKLRILEIAQVPKQHVDDFKSVKTFRYFNTNNIWIQLPAIKKVLDEGLLNMEIIVNPKTLENGTSVIQLETAVGAAMKSFNGCIGINVPRRRFLPVKKTSDMLLVMSNLYKLSNGHLLMSPDRLFPTTPLVKLGDRHFAKVNEFLKRFASIPDILDLDHLTVSGDVTFGRNVILKGTVIIIANHGDRIDIPSGAILENKIVSGNLRILDH